MLIRMSLIAGACALWPYVLQKLPPLGARPEYRISFSQVQVIPAPEDPVPANLVEQVSDLSGMPSELSLLSEGLTAEIAQAFRRHPWVSRVIRVHKSFPAAIVVELEYRKPVVMAQVQGGRIPLDAQGVVLPTSDFTTSDSHRYPLIQNVVNRPKVRPGNQWNDPGILAATRLAAFLGPHWKALKLDAISLSRITSTTEADDVILELVGTGGSKIVWGRAPGSDHPGELEPIQKIRRLEKYLVDYGDYNHPHGPYEIDIRHWQEISRRPLIHENTAVKPVKSLKPTSKGKSETSGAKLREANKPKVERFD